MKLSMPNPMRDTLPATAPAITATNPSKVFQPMVKYSSLRPRRRTAVRSNIAVSAMSSVYNVPRRAVGFAVSSELYDGYKGVKDRIHGRPHIRRSCLLIPVFLLISAPAFGQCTSTDSQPLQALLAELRQLHHDLQTTTIAAQRAHILPYLLQGQQAT